jgi:hypothetical protein
MLVLVRSLSPPGTFRLTGLDVTMSLHYISNNMEYPTSSIFFGLDEENRMIPCLWSHEGVLHA